MLVNTVTSKAPFLFHCAFTNPLPDGPPLPPVNRKSWLAPLMSQLTPSTNSFHALTCTGRTAYVSPCGLASCRAWGSLGRSPDTPTTPGWVRLVPTHSSLESKSSQLAATLQEITKHVGEEIYDTSIMYYNSRGRWWCTSYKRARTRQNTRQCTRTHARARTHTHTQAHTQTHTIIRNDSTRQRHSCN